MGRLLISLIIGAASLVSLGCRDGPAMSTVAAVRDSAGVRILSVARETARLSLSASPVLQVGAASGDEDQTLFRASSGFLLPDGRLFAANSGTHEVRVYDRQGALIDRFGARGAGPGEFAALDWMTRIGPDSLAVLDIDQQRVTAFTIHGEALWSRSVSVPLAVPMTGPFYSRSGEFFLLWDSGDIFDQIGKGSVRVGQTARNTAALYRYPPDGSEPELVAEVPGPEAAVIESASGGVATTFPPLGRWTSYAVDADRIYLGDQASGDIRVFDLEGALVGLVRLPTEDLTVTAADVAAYRDAVLARASGTPEQRAALLRRIDGFPWAPQRPAYGRLMIDDAGRLWVSDWHHLFAPPDQWTVVDTETGRRWTLSVPAAFDVFWADDQRVLGRWTDELGVEYLQVYEFAEEG